MSRSTPDAPTPTDVDNAVPVGASIRSRDPRDQPRSRDSGSLPGHRIPAPEGWEEFYDACQALGNAAAWTRGHDDWLSHQVQVRHLLPAHRSTAGAEAVAHRLRNLYEQRSFSLRNAHRTNLLFGLTRLHLNNVDGPPTTASCGKQPKQAAGDPDKLNATTATPERGRQPAAVSTLPRNHGRQPHRTCEALPFSQWCSGLVR